MVTLKLHGVGNDTTVTARSTPERKLERGPCGDVGIKPDTDTDTDTDTNTDTDTDTDANTDANTDTHTDSGTDFDPLLPADAAAIVDTAQALLRASGESPTNAALKGKQLGLMCATEAPSDAPKANIESSDADIFRLAATRLGAHVARIRPRLSAASSTAELRRLAVMLGRLYDAVECQNMPLDLVKKIKAQAGVPVFFKLASVNHPTAALTSQLQGNAPAQDKRIFVLQASLLRSLERAA